jgi:hypothetical protein
MAKFCSNGHQMEDSWEICPYCQRTGFRNLDSPAAAKTRLEVEVPPLPAQPAPPAPAAARKTVLLSERHRAPVVGWLVALNGEQKGEDFRIREGQNAIGSSAECEIVLRDQAVSAKHASLRYRDHKFVLTDLDSTNGTYLNDGPEPISREDLKDNDVVRIGDVSLKFKCL